MPPLVKVSAPSANNPLPLYAEMPTSTNWASAGTSTENDPVREPVTPLNCNTAPVWVIAISVSVESSYRVDLDLILHGIGIRIGAGKSQLWSCIQAGVVCRAQHHSSRRVIRHPGDLHLSYRAVSARRCCRDRARPAAATTGEGPVLSVGAYSSAIAAVAAAIRAGSACRTAAVRADTGRTRRRSAAAARTGSIGRAVAAVVSDRNGVRAVTARAARSGVGARRATPGQDLVVVEGCIASRSTRGTVAGWLCAPTTADDSQDSARRDRHGRVLRVRATTASTTASAGRVVRAAAATTTPAFNCDSPEHVIRNGPG